VNHASNRDAIGFFNSLLVCRAALARGAMDQVVTMEVGDASQALTA